MKKTRRPKKTLIHVNQHVIRANKKTGASDPVLTVKSGKENRYAHTVAILGPSSVVYSPDKPLSCGARVWIETYAEVVLDGGPSDVAPDDAPAMRHAFLSRHGESPVEPAEPKNHRHPRTTP